MAETNFTIVYFNMDTQEPHTLHIMYQEPSKLMTKNLMWSLVLSHFLEREVTEETAEVEIDDLGDDILDVHICAVFNGINKNIFDDI